MSEAPFPRRPRELRDVFSTIHRRNVWGNTESRSGPGSTRERADMFLPGLLQLVRRLGVATLIDAPCGDFNWAAPLADAVEHYIGIDIVPDLVRGLRQRHAAPHRRFLCRDFVHQRLPAGDLILCRDGLVHLSIAHIFAALANFRRSGTDYVLLTTFVGEHANGDIDNGGWRPLNLQRSPFCLPNPLELLDEHCHHTGGIYRDKRLGLWRSRDLPEFPPERVVRTFQTTV